MCGYTVELPLVFFSLDDIGRWRRRDPQWNSLCSCCGCGGPGCRSSLGVSWEASVRADESVPNTNQLDSSVHATSVALSILWHHSMIRFVSHWIPAKKLVFQKLYQIPETEM